LQNNASGNYSFIGGGRLNTASNGYSVASGRGNNATGYYSFIGGGVNNTASGYGSMVVGGGFGNNATGCLSIVVGGYNNNSYAYSSIVGGGTSNIASCNWTSVLGGNLNCAMGIFSSVVGGCGNRATGYGSFIGGGRTNLSSGCFSSIMGGCGNTASGAYSSVLGGGGTYGGNTSSGCSSVTMGVGNTASNSYSVAMGLLNTVSSYRSGIFGGWNNIVSAQHSAVLAGNNNCVLVGTSTIVGGSTNKICSGNGFIGGGQGNIINAATCDSSIIGSSSSCVGNFWGGTILNSGYGYSYLTRQLVLNTNYAVSSLGEYQNSIIAPYLNKNFTTASSNYLGLMGGIANGSDPIIPSGNNRSWQIRIKYTAVVTAISGTATGVSVGDTKTQTQEIGVKKVGGTTSILTGSPNNGISLEDPSMNNAQMTYSVGGSQQVIPTFTGPIFAGGGTLTIKINMVMELCELSW
jgi:hypothetical protein